MVTLDADGQKISEKRIGQDEMQVAQVDPRYQILPRMLEQKYIPEYDFDDIEGRVTLAHYAFEHFDQWPRFVYFFPVVFSDWDGTAFLDIHHQGEVLKVRLLTFFFCGVLYMGSSLDGQLYPHGIASSDVAFLEVNESSFGHSMNGAPDIHREGYGLYVIRPR